MATKKIPHVITINGAEYLAESRAAAIQHLKAVIKRASVADVLRIGTDSVIKETAPGTDTELGTGAP
jgi:hypothetical protein